jgi:hypothetical protein
LLEVEPVWVAEAERFDGTLTVASATGATVNDAWAALLDDIDAERVQVTSRIRLVGR